MIDGTFLALAIIGLGIFAGSVGGAVGAFLVIQYFDQDNL